jgi:hypothetical protein
MAGGADSMDATGTRTSADGTRAFFTTKEPLVAEDTDAETDVYERAAGATTLVSDGPADPDPNTPVNLVAVSSDGSKALLYTAAPLTAADGDSVDDLCIRDTVAGTTTLVSDGPTDSSEPVTAGTAQAPPDLSKVAFATKEQIDATNDTDTSDDVYVWSGGTPQLVSDPGGASADPANEAFPGAFSDDGNLLTFTAEQSLAAADTDSVMDVYQRTGGGAPVLVSDRVGDPDGAFPATLAAQSRDGSHVVFFTQEKIVGEDGDGAFDAYESVSGAPPVLVSDRVRTGADADADVTDVSTTADGSKIFFGTVEQITEDDGDNAKDVYERSGGATTLVSDSPFEEGKDAQLQRASPDGSHVFWTTDEAVVPDDGDSSFDVYQRSAGATTLVSDRVQPGTDGAHPAAFRGTSTDGSRVFFTTKEPVTASDGDTASTDVYERAGGVTTLLSDRQKAGADEAVDAAFNAATPDGAHVFFATPEQLLAADGDASRDVYGARIVAGPPPGGGGNPPPPGGGTLLPGACANVFKGTPRADVLAGTVKGDRISAGNGNDAVNGLAGADCLLGQGGNDTLSGGPGNDALDGGKGNDRLAGGKGRNRYKGGPGNDTISARNRKKEKIDCGKGRKDRATVDKKDKVKGCERVKRR